MRPWLPFALPLLAAGCSPPASPIAVMAVARHPEAFFARRIELCGDLGERYDGGFGKTEMGYPLFSPGGEGSTMHGRVGVFVPAQPWLARYSGKAVCVTGSISHSSGMTPAELAQQPYRDSTTSAVDGQWHFDPVSLTVDRTRTAKPG